MPLLETQNLTAYYGDFQALFGIDTYVEQGETVAIIGANGAGKSTYLNSLTGLHRGAGNAVRFENRLIGNLEASAVVKLGMSLVPEGRRLFSSLSVEENLLIGAYGRKGKGKWNLKTVYELFPVLERLKNLPATSLSGGQQQMVAFGRALMSNPQLLLCDEVSLGLAPTIIRDIYGIFPLIKEAGSSIIVVEQDVQRALSVADRVYCFMEGRVTLTGKPSEMEQTDIRHAYFGAA